MMNVIYFSVVIVVSGIVFVNRISASFIRKMPFDDRQMTKIGTFYLAISFVVFIFNFSQPFNLFLLIFLLNLISPCAFFIYLKWLQTRFQSEFLRFLSLTILRMKLGQGLVSAYASTLGQKDWKYALVLRELMDNVAFSPQKAPHNHAKSDYFLVSCLKVLNLANDNPGSAIKVLENFRDHLILQHRFRRRSGQIWSQVLIQATVIAALYLLLFVYMMMKYKISDHITIYLSSIVLFLSGILVLVQFRKVKIWKQ